MYQKPIAEVVDFLDEDIMVLSVENKIGEWDQQLISE